MTNKDDLFYSHYLIWKKLQRQTFSGITNSQKSVGSLFVFSGVYIVRFFKTYGFNTCVSKYLNQALFKN